MKIVIHKEQPTAYIPKEVRDGFDGEMNLFLATHALVIKKNGSSYKETVNSLKLLIGLLEEKADLELTTVRS